MALPLAVSTLGIVLIVFGVIVLIALALGLAGARARDRKIAPHWEEHVAAADQALEQAKAADRGLAPRGHGAGGARCARGVPA